jgi:hypothetical protein
MTIARLMRRVPASGRGGIRALIKREQKHRGRTPLRLTPHPASGTIDGQLNESIAFGAG